MVAFVEQNLRITPSDAWRKVDELPFDFVRRLSVILEGGTANTCWCARNLLRGSPPACTRTVSTCRSTRTPPGVPAGQRAIQNRDGFRAVRFGTCIAHGVPGLVTAPADEARPIAGLLTFLDPPKEAAGHNAALRGKRRGGEGAHRRQPVVSAKICREVGLTI